MLEITRIIICKILTHPKTINHNGILFSIGHSFRYIMPITTIDVGKNEDKAINTITITKR